MTQAKGGVSSAPQDPSEAVLAGVVQPRLDLTRDAMKAATADDYGRLSWPGGALGPSNGAGRLLTNWQNGTLTKQSAGAGEAFALDAATTVGGEPMVKCSLSSTPAAVFQGRITLTTPIFLGDCKTLQIPIKFSSNRSEAMAGALVQVWLYTNGGLSVRPQLSLDSLAPGLVHLLSFNQQCLIGGSTNWSAFQGDTLNRVEIVITAGSAAVGLDVWVGPIRASARKTARLNIICDGEYSQQNDCVLPLLDRYGLKCSFALTNKDIGTGGRMSQAQLLAAYTNGHDLIHHTFGNWANGWDNVGSYPDAASITADINSQWAYLTSIGATRGIGHCVTPYTDPFAAASVSLARQQLVRDALVAAGVKTLRVGGRRLQNASIFPSVGALHSIADQRRTWVAYTGGVMLNQSLPATTLTLSQSTVGAATATATNAFSAAYKGQYIAAGTGGGYARITAVTDASNVSLDIRRAFSATSFTSGNWSRGDSGQTVKDLIDAAIEYGEMATVAIHRLVLTSGAVGGLEQYVDDAAEWVEYAAAKQRSGELIVQKIADTFAEAS